MGLVHGWSHRGASPATVIRVVDGDTIVARLANGAVEKIRLLGVDTPEVVDPRKPVQCFGHDASAFTKSRLTGRRVSLELDAEQRDKYGRLLAYVILDGHRYNDELLERGYALPGDPAQRLPRPHDAARGAGRQGRPTRTLGGVLSERPLVENEPCAVCDATEPRRADVVGKQMRFRQ